jgi:sucrose phosphorylase
VYDFALPPLVLHTLYTHSAAALKHWLRIRPRNAITVLDTHDGIGVADAARSNDGLPGLLTPDEVDNLVKTIHQRSRGESRAASGSEASNVDTSQINCTLYDALGRRDAEYLVARAIQCFVPGIPQVYYVGLLAGCNDIDLLRRTGVGRDINRHYYTADELRVGLTQPVVQSLLALLQIRNTHPAFQGTFDLLDSAVERIALVWTDGEAFARLDVDVTAMCASITCSSHGAPSKSVAAWHTFAEARA